MYRSDRGVKRVYLAVTAAIVLASFNLGAQNLSVKGPGPAMASRIDQGERQADTHKRRPVNITLNVVDSPLSAVIKLIEQQGDVRISYSRDVVPVARRVSINVKGSTPQSALEAAIKGLPLRVFTASTGQLVIEPVKKAPDNQKAKDSAHISGRVVDSTTDMGVAGVRVAVEGSQIAVVSGEDGRYTLVGVPFGRRIITARHLGFGVSQRTVDVDRSDLTVDFRIGVVATRLSGVITTGTGEQRRFEVGQHVATIQADEIVRNTPVRTVDDILANRVPGLQSLRSGGNVGAGNRNVIRGMGSIISNNDPIIILDGVRIDGRYSSNERNEQGPANNMANDAVAATSRLNDIDPETIESIDVLRGPSAAALYGSEAATGVIVIKTKRGVAGTRRYTFVTQQGRSSVNATFPEPHRPWGYFFSSPTNPECLSIPHHMGQCVIDSATSYNPLNDASTSPLDKGYESVYRASVSGGSSRLQYYLNGSYESRTGIAKMPKLEQLRVMEKREVASIPGWQIRPNLLTAARLTNRLTTQFSNGTDLSVTAMYINQDARGTGERDGAGIIASALSGPGYVDPVQRGWGSTPPGEMFSERNTNNVNRYALSANSTYRGLSWFTLNAAAGVDYADRADSRLNRAGELSETREGTISLVDAITRVYTVNWNAVSNHVLPRSFNLRLTAGSQFTSNRTSSDRRYGRGLPEGSSDINEAATITPGTGYHASATLGTFGEVSLSYKNRFFLPVSLRQDRSSSLGPDAKNPFFPKAGLSWVVSEEPVFSRLPFGRHISNFRLRLATGQAGIQPAIDQVFRSFKPSSGISIIPADSGYVAGTLGNANLKEERSIEVEGGADLGLWDDRLTLELTLYRKITNDALIRRVMPPSFGIGSRQENLGKVENSGLELMVSAQPLNNRHFTWRTNTAFSVNRNQLKSLGDNVRIDSRGEVYRVGYPVAGIFDYAIISYADDNGDGWISEGEIVYSDSLVYLGQRMPKATANFGNSFGFLNNTLNINTNFELQHKMVQVNDVITNQCRRMKCRGAADINASLEEKASAVSVYRTLYGFYENVSWIRFSSLSVGYNVPSDIVSRISNRRVRSMNVAIMGRNLGLWTKYRGADPEVNTSPGGLSRDYGGTPQTRDWVLNLRLGW